jgi:hypothetical protein
MRFRHRHRNSVRKCSFKVPGLRFRPSHSVSALSELLTTVGNLSFFPCYSSSNRIWRGAGLCRFAAQHSW